MAIFRAYPVDCCTAVTCLPIMGGGGMSVFPRLIRPTRADYGLIAVILWLRFVCACYGPTTVSISMAYAG